MDKVHVIVNPYSARGQTQKRWEKIREAIKSHYRDFKYIFTEKPKQATDIAREVLKDGFDLIIGVGGDGTLNEISNGFFQHDSSEAINGDASLGIVPSGTGSDFIRFMKIPRDFRQSVEAIKNSLKKKIDLGRITFTGLEKGRNVQYFINVADFGLGAEVIRTMADTDSLKRGAFTYYKGLLKTLLSYSSKKVKIQIDDGQTIEGQYLIGAVANGRVFGGGMIIAPDAEPDDGYLDLVLVGDMKKMEIIANTPRLYRGTIAGNPKVKIIKTRRLKVSSDDQVNIEYDGEVGPRLPATFEVVEKAINFRI